MERLLYIQQSVTCIMPLPHTAGHPQDADEAADASPLEEDSYDVLVSGGVHPLLAARAADTNLPEVFVMAWSLLLACMMDSSHDRRRRLGLTCGHVDGYASRKLGLGLRCPGLTCGDMYRYAEACNAAWLQSLAQIKRGARLNSSRMCVCAPIPGSA